MKQHPKVQEYLNSVTSEVKFKEARPGIQEELLSHIEEHLQTAQSYGIGKEDAIAESIKRMGNSSEVGASLNGIHQPKIDFMLIAVVAVLCAIGLFAVQPRGWAGSQTLWIVIGAMLASVALTLPYDLLKKTLVALYPLAIIGLIGSHFSGISIEGEPYLALFGLKIKMIDLGSLLMVAGLPAIAETFQKQRLILLPALILIPVLYFVMIGSTFPAALLLVGGVVVMSYSSHWVSVASGTVGALFISLFGTMPFLSSEQLKTALIEESHTDFVLSGLIQGSHIGAALAVALFVVFLVHLSLRVGSIKTRWLRATSVSCAATFGAEILFGVTSNYGFAPMFKTGANVPFLSYGGSLMVVHLFMIGVVLACLKRESIQYPERSLN